MVRDYGTGKPPGFPNRSMCHGGSMAFQPDRRFESMEDACAFLIDEQARRPVDRLWTETGSGIVVPRDVPRYLFRGENGCFDTTVSSIHRSETFALRDGSRLSVSDLRALRRLIPCLALHFVRNQTYSLNERQAYGLLQHYHLPTTIVDFTGDLTNALAFAAAGDGTVGRVAVLTLPECLESVIDFTDHPWAERAQRQAAFGVIPPDGLIDLKSEAARSRLGLRWYEFPVSPSDRDCLRSTGQELQRWTDDPSAGFLRFHITEFVEAHGKFSPELTGWLLDRVPMAPYCYMAERFEGRDVVVYFRSSKDLPSYDESAERERSRRYWSSVHPECFSAGALEAFSWRPLGEITCDPRTYHAD
jgi:hypothetical protein